MNNNSTYKRLGDYIREVDVRNSDLRCTNLLGLSNAKVFIPSIANMVGTDLRPYKIVKHNQFAYVPVTSRNGEKITVALYTGDDSAIVSQAYVVFEIVGTCDTVETLRATSLQCDQLLPEYLMMWFRRAEFDRYARFHSHGSAREVFDWEEMCNVMLPVPSIEEQRRIVDRYNAIKTRIENNKKTIVKLEEAAQALYRKMFVDDVDVENLPEGWRMGTLGEVLSTKGYIRGPFGSSLKVGDMVQSGVPVYEQQHIIDNHRKFRYFVSEEKYASLKRFSIQNDDLVISCSGTIGRIVHITDSDPKGIINQALLILRVNKQVYSPTILKVFFSTQTGYEALIEEAHGSAQVNIGKREQIEKIPIIIPNKNVLNNINNHLEVLFNSILVLKKETEKLTEMLSVVMA